MLSVADAEADEAAGNIDFVVSLDEPAGAEVTVDYATADDTAVAGEDYEAANWALTFSPGDTSKTVSVVLLDDRLYGLAETFSLILSNVVGAELEDGTAVGTIRNDDSRPLMQLRGSTATEPDDLEYVVSLSSAAEATVSVKWETVTSRLIPSVGPAYHHLALHQVDYRYGSGTLTFEPGETRKPVTVTVNDDAEDEPLEVVIVELRDIVNAGWVNRFSSRPCAWNACGIGTFENNVCRDCAVIRDDDLVELSVRDASAAEGDSELALMVELGSPTYEEVSVSYATMDGTALAGEDYETTSGSLTIPAGQERREINVALLDDGSLELDEAFTVTLSSPEGAKLGDAEGIGTITDNDVPGLSVSGGTGTEGGVVDFVVTLAPAGVKTATVSYATSDGTATAGEDYEAMTETVTFPPGETTRTITVPLLEDEVDEAEETFAVTLSNAVDAMIDSATADGTILDNNPTSTEIALTASQTRVAEDDGATDIDVTAMLDGAARTSAIEVTVSVAGSGNAGAVDFAEVEDFTITIAALHNRGAGTFTLTPIDDDVDESDETLSVTGTSFVTVTGTEVELVDDDATSSSIALTAQPPRVSEGDGSTEVGVTATLDAGARTEETTVTVTVSGSGDADAVDFADVRDFTITIAEGDTSGTGSFTLTPEDDNVDETDETINVDGNSDLTVTADTVTLADDDQPSGAILLSTSPGRITEDGGATPVRVTATLDASARTVATTVSVSVSGSGQPDAVGYAASATAFDIMIAVGATTGTGTFTVTPEDDQVDERDEVLDITGTSDLPVTPTSVTLTDDDQTSTEILLSAVPSTVSEGAGATPVEVTATLDAGARTVSTTVAVTVSGSGNADTVDFADVRGFTIMIAAGDTSGSGNFTLTPEDDNVDESDETLNVDGSSVLPVTADTVALADDDQPSAAILLSASPGRISEDGGARRLRVRATLDSSARTVATTVSVSVSGSGRPDAVDYAPSATAFDITIAAGATAGTRTFTVTPEDDEVDERDEVLDIAGTSNLPVTPTSVTLTDDEQTSTEILLSAVPSTVSEGAGATPVEVTATLDAGARTVSTTVTVTVSESGNADADAVDFADVRDFTIMIAAGATSGRATFTLTPEDDNVAESSETVTVDGRSDIPVTQTSVTLTDDDVASSGIVLSASPSLVSEDGGAVGVRVTASLNGAVSQAATTVSVSVAGSGNPQAVDFQPVADFTITIAANAASGTGTFTLTPRDDATVEADETLTVSGASDLPVTPATVTLADDDDPSTRILLSAVPERVSEGDGPTSVTVTATLDRALRQQATPVAVMVSGSGDAGAADFAAVADFSITIPANAASGTATFTLTPRDDATVEADETLTVSGASDLPVTPATVTLADDDDPSTRILLSAVPERVSEGDGPTSVTVTATLDRALRQQATPVAVMVSGSGDAGAADFAAVADFSITIPANAASGTATFTLTPRDDATVEADETLTVSGASDLPVTPATVTLADDDDPSTRILLSAVPERVSEGDGPTSVTVTATLDRALRQQATPVAVMVSGSGDAGAADFAAVADFSITIPANAASGTGTFTLTPRDDATVEADEQLTVSGTSVLPVTPAVVTLADDDEVSTRILLFLAVDPPRGSEGDGEIRVTVTASVDRGVRPDETRIRVSVSGSGDPDAVDFAPIPDFDIVIAANAPEGRQTFTVVPEDDLIVEADELLTVSGASDLPVTPATMELLDDDEASGRIVLSADPARVSEGGGPVAVTVTASLDRGLRQKATTVAVSVSGGGNPDAVDFDPVADFTITIAANAASGTGTFTLMPEDDAEDEADETLALTGESDLPVTPASVVLADDDEMASRVLSIADAEAAESAGEVRFAVTLDGPSAAEVTVGYETADPAGSVDPVAGVGIDYESAAGTLTFAPGEVSRTIRVSVLDDSRDEPDETFALVLSDPRGARLGQGSALGTIRDDDEPPALSIAGDTGPEDVGELVFSVTLMARALTEVTVNYATMDDTAIAEDDYVPVEGTLTFAPGETAKTIRVAVVDDAVDEADEESFAVTLSGHSGATLAHSLATGVIRDDDEPPALSVADAAGDEDVGTLEFAVTLSIPSGIEVSVSYATMDDSATADSDYAAATGTLVFAPGEVSQTIRVAILDDAANEADEETFELTLARLVNATAADVSATGTIRDNDLAPPSVAGDLPAALLCVGGAPYELDLADYFAGNELRFSAVSSTPLVATAALDGSRLIVTPASEGESSVTVTATNDSGSVSSSIGVRVITDPAELEAVESVLASIGRAVLTGVTDSVRARFGPRSAIGEQSASTNVQRGRTQVVPGASAVLGNQWAGPAMHGTRFGGWDGSGLLEPQVSGDDWFETTNRTYRRGMVPFSFSLDSSQSGTTGPAWGVWGRADAHRFESGMDGNSHDGTLTAVHLGADARVGDWLAGVSVANTSAEADYRFERSVDACGGGGTGEGMVDAELTSVHPYVGRQIGRGSVWATLGAGSGEVSVERCETGRRNETDLSMRLAALGGRHPFAGGERIEVSVVEEISVLDLTTGDALGPVGDRSVSVGQARLGLEATGVATPGCDCSLTTFVRGFARGDWGDGATGAGLELAAGVRFRNLPQRLGIDAGIRALAVHSAEDAKEHSANLTFSILPKADGTGWQASLAWRRGARNAGLDILNGIAPWTVPSGNLPGAKRDWIAQSRLGYGIAGRRGSATPFVELDAGHSGRGGARFGVRHEFGDRVRGLVVEWGIEPSSFGSAGSRILLQTLGRF